MSRPISLFARPRRAHLVMLAFALLAIVAIVIARTPISAALFPPELTTASTVTDLALPLIALPFTWALLVRN
jgi:hypothetical protein